MNTVKGFNILCANVQIVTINDRQQKCFPWYLWAKKKILFTKAVWRTRQIKISCLSGLENQLWS
jgi:hypothetical protein